MRDHFKKFAPKGKERLLPSESHRILCLGILDGFDIVVEEVSFLQKGFACVSFLFFEGVAECEGRKQLTKFFYGSRPLVLFVALMEDSDKVQRNMRRVLDTVRNLGNVGLVVLQSEEETGTFLERATSLLGNVPMHCDRIHLAHRKVTD